MFSSEAMYTNGLVQDCSNSCALAMKLPQPCAKPSIQSKVYTQTATGHIDGLVQDCSNSSANALGLLQSCTKPSISIWQPLTRSFSHCNSSEDCVPVDELKSHRGSIYEFSIFKWVAVTFTLKIGYQDRSPHNGSQDDIPYWVNFTLTRS